MAIEAHVVFAAPRTAVGHASLIAGIRVVMTVTPVSTCVAAISRGVDARIKRETRSEWHEKGEQIIKLVIAQERYVRTLITAELFCCTAYFHTVEWVVRAYFTQNSVKVFFS